MAKHLMVKLGDEEMEVTRKVLFPLLRKDFRSRLVDINWSLNEQGQTEIVCKMSADPTQEQIKILKVLLSPNKIADENIHFIKARKNISRFDALVSTKEAFLNSLKGDKIQVRQEKLFAAFESLKVLGIDLISDPQKPKRGGGRTKGKKNKVTAPTA